MATVRVETVVKVGAELVWAAVADVGAVHLPHAMAPAVLARTERGIAEIGLTLEGASTPRS